MALTHIMLFTAYLNLQLGKGEKGQGLKGQFWSMRFFDKKS